MAHTPEPEDKVVIELNPREQRLYDRLRAHVVDPQTTKTTGVRDLLLLLPDMVVLLIRLMRDDRVPMGSKLVAMVGVGYVLSPLDLIPDLLLGPIALIDDLVIVGAALSRVVNQVHPDVVRSHWSGKHDALDAIRRVTDWAGDQLSTGLRRLANGIFPAARSN